MKHMIAMVIALSSTCAVAENMKLNFRDTYTLYCTTLGQNERIPEAMFGVTAGSKDLSHAARRSCQRAADAENKMEVNQLSRTEYWCEKGVPSW